MPLPSHDALNDATTAINPALGLVEAAVMALRRDEDALAAEVLRGALDKLPPDIAAEVRSDPRRLAEYAASLVPDDPGAIATAPAIVQSLARVRTAKLRVEEANRNIKTAFRILTDVGLTVASTSLPI